MAVFSRFSKVVEADDWPMRVRTALQLINHILDELLTEQDSEYETRDGLGVILSNMPPDCQWAPGSLKSKSSLRLSKPYSKRNMSAMRCSIKNHSLLGGRLSICCTCCVSA
jgi:hypothetical protein